MPTQVPSPGFRDAADFGFQPDATGLTNQHALQQALDQGGTVTISRPGTYLLAGTVLIGSRTSLLCGAGVVIRKHDEEGPFTHVLLNKGALTKTWDEDIVIDGLHIEVNGMDLRHWRIFGLHGQIGLFYVRDIRIHRFRCYDLGRSQYGIHVCTFEDLLVDDVIIHGHKDGVHLGRGKRFTIRHGVFGTSDDAVALNAHDYDVGNPELGWIEDGIVEGCHDLRLNREVGFFARILAGAWGDWRSGMEVRKSDTVVSEGRLYRVSADPDGTVYRSLARPRHAAGSAVLDGITWVMVQEDVTYTAGVRNVTFRDIRLSKPRIGLSIHFDNDRYSRSYYPGSRIPVQENLTFDGVHILHDEPTAFVACNTPVNAVSIVNSTFRRNHIGFYDNQAMDDYGRTSLNLVGNTFAAAGAQTLLTDPAAKRRITLSVTGSQILQDDFIAQALMDRASLTMRQCDIPYEVRTE